MKDHLFQKLNHKSIVELRLLAYTWLVLLLNVVIIIKVGAFSAILATLMLLTTALFIHALRFNRSDFITSLISACVTPFFDITAHIYDLWHFTSPTIAGIPYWLPFMYMVSSLVILRLKELIED
ncbi:MAG: hypothetical protein RI911_479 [Candidatus Parcubacteria bacterium]|jgi:hypothetical protein